MPWKLTEEGDYLQGEDQKFISSWMGSDKSKWEEPAFQVDKTTWAKGLTWESRKGLENEGTGKCPMMSKPASAVKRALHQCVDEYIS